MTSRTRTTLLAILAVGIGLSIAARGQSKPLSNDSVLQMIAWKAAPSEVIGLIERNRGNTDFTLTASEVNKLKTAGVSEDVLKEMFQATLSQAGYGPKVDDPPAPAAPAKPAASAAASARAASLAFAAPAPSAAPDPPAPQTTPPANSTPPTTTTPPAPTDGGGAKPATQSDVQNLQQQVTGIKNALQSEDGDFAAVLGVGSLIVNSGVTDYQNQSNVIHSANLGRATPQFLTGVSFRSKLPNFRRFDCGNHSHSKKSSTAGPSSTSSSSSGDQTASNPDSALASTCESWQRQPWAGFLSLKFAPGASQTLNGYVLGGTYSIAHYLNAFIGFSLTPINEPAPGFRTTAAQFVISQQKLGHDLNFNPTAMLNNSQNAFDGFPVTDSSGRLIFQGNPLTVHYRGGAVFGVSIPLYLKSLFSGQPSSQTNGQPGAPTTSPPAK